jgi:transketolase
VKLVAVGGGFAYGALGASHHATEDLAVARVLPNMTVVAPGDPIEAGLATRALAARPGPGYLRLGKAGEPTVHGQAPPFTLGRAIVVREGRACTLMATGGMLPIAVEAADTLHREHGVDARVLSMHTLKPFDTDAVRTAALETRAIVTVEEHSEIGGLGSAVAEVLARLDRHPRFTPIALASSFATTVGDQCFLRDRAGLSAPNVVRTVMDTL